MGAGASTRTMDIWAQRSHEKLRVAEDYMLRVSNIDYEHRMVKANDDGACMHTVICGDPSKPALVMGHGFGQGLAFFNHNIATLSRYFRVYLVDWLGCGRSDRPKYKPKGPREAELWFVDALEMWRQNLGLEDFVLVGHSLGGFLSSVYALEHPNRVTKLILLSPVGLPRKPPKGEEGGEKMRVANSKDLRVRTAFSILLFCWNRNISPQQVLRGVGYNLGQKGITLFVNRRFHHFDEEYRKAMATYMYHISARPGSGEYAFGYILQPVSLARLPLCDRLHNLKMPVTFLYGSHDWMDLQHAEEAKLTMKVPVNIYSVSHSGHHLYMENPRAVNEHIVRAVYGDHMNVIDHTPEGFARSNSIDAKSVDPEAVKAMSTFDSPDMRPSTPSVNVLNSPEHRHSLAILNSPS